VTSHAAEIDAWRARRVARLTAPDGWLSVVGLSWLEEGENSVGSAPGARVALPSRAPARVGTIRLESAPGQGTRFTLSWRALSVEPHSPIELQRERKN